MAVQRIVATLAADRLEQARSFYCAVLGLDLVMDHGWIVTFAATGSRSVPQISIAVEGGSGAPVPDVSGEVDDLDEELGRATAAAVPVEYGPAVEPWGVRRAFLRDPFGRLVNVLTHLA